MPWSDWIQSPNVEQFPAARRRIEFFTGDLNSVAFDLTTDATDVAGAQASVDPFFEGHRGTQYKVRTTWDQPTPIPPELGSLTFGVDYAVKPGSDLSDPYRYVDYDPDDHAEVIGWAIPSPVVYDREFDFDLGADVWIDPATDYDTGTIGPLVIGATFDTIDPTTPAGTVLAAPPDPGSTLSFTVGISPHIPLDNSGSVSVTMSGSFFEGWPIVTVRPQKWRYWKPGITPLRQYPRNDGLKGGAPSARPTSRQGTTARRTYL